MPFFTYTTIPFAFLLLAAHFYRFSHYGLVVVALLAPFLLVAKNKRSHLIVQLLLFAGSLVWLHAGGMIVLSRLATGETWLRAAVIMVAVALFTVLGVLLLHHPKVKERYSRGGEGARIGAVAFLLVAIIGAFPHVKMHDPVPLLAERFLHGGGWVELFFLALYAAWLAEKLVTTSNTAKIRKTAWLAFSGVFFLQVILGLAGFEKLLMTGSLHLPVPAMIIAAPLYRGEWSLFMPVLLFSTVLFAGPAWCSWFCYLGSWDFIASQAKPVPSASRHNTVISRLLVITGICSGAVLLRVAGVPLTLAIAGGVLFGTIGVAIMLLSSRKKGIMMHCTAYCPIGLITTVAGKINPFRIRVGKECTRCHACIKTCRYGALTLEAIIRRKPSITCTLCGDCTSACATGQIQYHFMKLSNVQAKQMFLVIVVVIHALFMGFGRL